MSSLTPIFDATLADAPRNIREAAPLLFGSTKAPETLFEALGRIGHPSIRLQPDFTDWEHINGYPQGATS
jgi:hypothetical protein